MGPFALLLRHGLLFPVPGPFPLDTVPCPSHDGHATAALPMARGGAPAVPARTPPDACAPRGSASTGRSGAAGRRGLLGDLGDTEPSRWCVSVTSFHLGFVLLVFAVTLVASSETRTVLTFHVTM